MPDVCVCVSVLLFVFSCGSILQLPDGMHQIKTGLKTEQAGRTVCAKDSAPQQPLEQYHIFDGSSNSALALPCTALT